MMGMITKILTNAIMTKLKFRTKVVMMTMTMIIMTMIIKMLMIMLIIMMLTRLMTNK
jgi:hypothetical protein